MTARTYHIAAFAAVALFGFAAAAEAQTQRAPPQRMQAQPQRPPGRLIAASPDLRPIPSRIEHGAVSVRNGGTAASAPSLATVNCHLPGQEGGCPDIPAAAIAPYENPAYPNVVVVSIPAIQPGHVHSHMLTFWDDVVWPSGTYVFEFVVDADAANAESNEANNTGSHIWVVP